MHVRACARVTLSVYVSVCLSLYMYVCIYYTFETYPELFSSHRDVNIVALIFHMIGVVFIMVIRYSTVVLVFKIIIQ